MVDQFGTMIAGDLAQMRDLAVAPADIEEAANVDRRPGSGSSGSTLIRLRGLLVRRLLLALFRHVRSSTLGTAWMRVRPRVSTTIVNLIFLVKIKT
jgi:hypothetical protein